MTGTSKRRRHDILGTLEVVPPPVTTLVEQVAGVLRSTCRADADDPRFGRIVVPREQVTSFLTLIRNTAARRGLGARIVITSGDGARLTSRQAAAGGGEPVVVYFRGTKPTPRRG